MPQKITRRQRWGRWALQLLGLALLAVLITRLDLPRVLATLRGAALLPILVAIAGLLPLIGLKTARWWLVMRGQGLHMRPGAAYQAYFASLFIGYLTPGRLGEFVKAFYVREESPHSTAHALSSVLADRLFDLYLLLGVGALALLRLVTGRAALVILLLAVLLIGPLWVFLADPSFAWLRRQGIRLGRIGVRLFADDGWLVDLRRGLHQIGWHTALIAGLLTLLAYGVFFSQCYLLARSLGLEVSYGAVMFAVALGSLIALVPVSINGLGTRDAAMIAYLRTAGVVPEAALSFSLLFFFTFTIAGGLIGAGAWLLRPVPLNVLRDATQDDSQ